MVTIDLKLGAFGGSEETKAFYVERMKEHRRADEIVQGHYWNGRNGCAVGCALEIDPDDIEESIHERYEKQLGIPRELACLQDGIFEGLSAEDAKEFPVQFLEAIRAGVSAEILLRKVDELLLWLLVDVEHGVVRFADARGKEAIVRVAALYRRKIDGELISDGEWSDAYAAARTADAAARTADAADAAYAAARAARAARTAAAARAAAAADAAARAAYAAARKAQADKLIELLASV